MKVLALFSLLLSFSSLFAQEEHRSEIHCKHFIYGYPYGTPATNDLIIRDLYALSNNDETKFADWVSYKLDREIISGPKRSRNWKVDPWLDEDETLEPEPDHGDYKDAHNIIKTDRGHQAPLASFDGSDDYFVTNYLSNITPQKSNLNQGPWARLEGKIRDLVYEVGDVYVMTGPLYETEMPPLPRADEPHKVPSGYWKIIITEIDDELEWCAFIFQQDTPRAATIDSYICSIDEIEERSGLDFLWLMKDDLENAIEYDKNAVWAIKMFGEE